ncbi:MAG: LCP family protein [Ruminococcus sp.]|nr:LCP family protein [Ruminococcus sp.]
MAEEKEKSLQEKIEEAKKAKDIAVEKKVLPEKEDFTLPHNSDIDLSALLANDSHHNHHHHHHSSHSSSHHHSSGHHHRHHKHRMSKKKRRMIIVVSVILGLLLAFLITAGIIIHSYISKINIVEEEAEIYETIDIDELVDEPDSPKEEITSLEEQIKANFNKEGLMESKDVMNILLLGTDARTNNERGRSDSMILVSINKQTKQIVMTSFLRDIYLTIPGIETTRLNHAYAYGGADLVIKTIEQNFKIKIDKYAQIDFTSFVNVIDAVGGVDLEITAEEAQYMPKYIDQIGGSGADYVSAGKQHLNGKQALAYSRIRYVGTDFGRTERQRKVLEQVFIKAKKLDIGELDDLMDKLLPNVTTNLTEWDLYKLILKSPSYFKFDLKQCRVPIDDSYEYMTIRSMSVIGIDFEVNKKYLYKNIFNAN